MVLLHGFTNDWRAWTPVLPLLEPHHNVFAPTLPGHFGADDFRDGEPASFGAMSDAVEREMDARGIERAHLVGNSQGGWLSLELAARGRALSVVGLCPAGGWEPGSPEERAVVRSFKRAKLALRLSKPWFETIAKRPRMRAIAFREMIARPSRFSAAAALGTLEAAAGCRIVDEMLALAETGDAFGELGPVDCPVTIATATKDGLFNRPGHYARLRHQLPKAEWAVLEGLGHLPMSDDPELVAELILARSRGG
jgi:pimeloyl-ACP methyl ester carboxylesterase